MPFPTAHPSPVRLGWLDMLRGVAALVVAAHHGAAYFTPDQHTVVNTWFNPGKYGVLLFFLISGYIIPASLERHGRLRAFWIGRATRIYPLLLVCLAATAVPAAFGAWRLHGGLDDAGTPVAIVAHLTMLQDLLAVPSALNVLWTLSYELVFYFLVAALFVAGRHRASAATTMAFAVGALALGGLLPEQWISDNAGIAPVVLGAFAVMALAIAAAVSGRAGIARAGALAGGVFGLCLLLFNSRAGVWESVSILAVMFLGTALYRAEHGQGRAWTAALATASVVGCSVAAGLVHGYPVLDGTLVRQFTADWIVPLLAALLSFAAGWAVRRRRVPGPLLWLGAISFSVYLVHPILLLPVHEHLVVGPTRAVWLAVFLGAVLAVSWATYRWIELPFQRWGKRLAAPSPAGEKERQEAVLAAR
ncbi:acyltransferase [Actinocorallia sp. A-T 12471]|uniref:acyltransferase family protein n=1 Tax=Actinocorallia sp. A-T 12471 TaxID=3089813 RepID=UPI0029CD2098|nr:acyltransferase [Actinocorallia sp. A-T 12471]MDX6741358.1 acyltransferase [Actinocorallia sp. A-T 12471]